MTAAVLEAGTPTPIRIDWAMVGGAAPSDMIVSVLWADAVGLPVDMTSAVVSVVFSAAPTGGRVPLPLSSAAANAEGGSIVLGNAAAAANMLITIPASATALYRFQTIRYAMVVTYPSSGTLRWAEGAVTFEDGP